MTSSDLFVRSANIHRPISESTKLMSADANPPKGSGPEGIAKVLLRLKVSSAKAVPPAASSAEAARVAASRVREENLANIFLPPLTSQDDATKRARRNSNSNAAYPSEVRLRFATLPGRLLDRPSKRRALGKVGRPRGKLARYYERLSIQPCAS